MKHILSEICGPGDVFKESAAKACTPAFSVRTVGVQALAARPHLAMLAALFVAFLFFSVGCDAKIESFKANDVYALSLASSRSTPTDTAKLDTAELITAWFGTPNQPQWPSDLIGDADAASIVDIDRLVRSAGSVKSIQTGEHVGLYREHCVACHGLEGSGTGPASVYQNPYPRDFRAGIFKWKSTERAKPPTRNDLRSTLMHGTSGTAMPAFSILDPEELESLIDYVIYLSIRGELERELLAAAIDELGYGETTPDDAELRFAATSQRDHATASEATQLALSLLQGICREWLEADEHIVAVPATITDESLSGVDLQASIERGRDIFHGQIANCVGCHGPAGGGAVATLDYDDWTKAYSTRLGLSPTDSAAMRPMIKAGAMPPRVADPRNLQTGVFRGGGTPDTLYRRITQGIAGTPMPAVEVTSEAKPTGLSIEQAADLIRYVRFLGDPTSMSLSAHNSTALTETQP